MKNVMHWLSREAIAASLCDCGILRVVDFEVYASECCDVAAHGYPVTKCDCGRTLRPATPCPRGYLLIREDET